MHGHAFVQNSKLKKNCDQELTGYFINKKIDTQFRAEEESNLGDWVHVHDYTSNSTGRARLIF